MQSCAIPAKRAEDSPEDPETRKGEGVPSTRLEGVDGSPQVTPVWVDCDGDYILVNTAMGRLKQENSKRNPNAVIAIADASNQYGKVTIRGVVTEQTTEGANDHIDKLAKKYRGTERYPWRSATENRVILRIRPEHVSG